MFDFLGRLFGSSKAIGNIVGSVSDGIDALVYTDEEQARKAAEARAEARQMLITWMQATMGQNLARRLLALVITSVWLLMYLVALGLQVTAIWVDPSLADSLRQSAGMIGSRAEQMNGAMMLILGFYFGLPYMGKFADAAVNKFSKSREPDG